MAKLEWNLGSSRIEFIGQLVNKVRLAHYRVEKKEKVRDLKNYRNLLKEIYFEIDMYVDSWSDHQPKHMESEPENVLKDSRTELQGRNLEESLNDTTFDVFEDLELVDRCISNARKAEGLDIPQRTEEDPEDAGVKGLQ